MLNTTLQPGNRVRFTQEFDRREGNWLVEVFGTVLSISPERTGSWYAHGEGDKLWLTRVRLQKENGEITTLVVDQNTRFEIVASS